MAREIVEREVSPVGKIPTETFERIIKPHLGRHRSEVIVGPQHGVDVGVVDLGDGQVMAITTDPFFVMPEYGWDRAAWFAVHIVASDAATSGLQPAYCTVDLNLPHSMTRAELEGLWSAVHRACEEIGMAIVTGHTGRYDGCDYPMLGAATVIGVGGKDRYVTPAMAREGDAVILTKGAGIETTALFGITFPQRIASLLGPEVARASADLFYQMSVVRDALTAVEVGVRDRGVTAMHDATERGVWGGLREMAEASRMGMIVDGDAILVRPETREICDLFGVDPYTTSSEGTLLLTCRPYKAAAVIDRLGNAGIDACRVGEITPAGEGIRVAHAGRERELKAPEIDPFWPAYRRALNGSET